MISSSKNKLSAIYRQSKIHNCLVTLRVNVDDYDYDEKFALELLRPHERHASRLSPQLPRPHQPPLILQLYPFPRQ
jgi:hypothetical protein